LLKSRLSRRIGCWVFLSVIIIETIIFIPSYRNHQKELLLHTRDISSAETSLIMRLVPPSASEKILLQKLQELRLHHSIIGGTLYRSDGKTVGSFGEKPELLFSDVRDKDITHRLSPNGSRYDIASRTTRPSGDYYLIVRNDSSFVKEELLYFFLRIAGLVVIISFFVAAGTLLTLGLLVINPIHNLRKDLKDAGKSISKDRQPPRFYSTSVHRRDELGEVIAAFRKMYQRISDAIIKRKNAEEALKQSLQQVEAYSKELNSELEKGRQMQKNFLPDQILKIPGWEIASYFKPARQVAGDFYDVFPLPGNNVGFVVADVCDKGVGAALFMALFRSLIRIFSGQALPRGLALQESCTLDDSVCPPGEDFLSTNPFHIDALKAIKLTNDYIAVHHGSLAMFATVFFGVLDPETGLLSYISGGHDPLFIISPNGGLKASLRPTGPAVGVAVETEFIIKQIYMDSGDILLGYTDGVPEASAEDDEFFTIARLLTLLENPASSATALIDRIVKSVNAHTDHAVQHDDVTLLAVRRIP